MREATGDPPRGLGAMESELIRRCWVWRGIFVAFALGCLSCVTSQEFFPKDDATISRSQDSPEPTAGERKGSVPRTTSIGNGLSQEEVLQVLKPHVTGVQACYQKLRSTQPHLKGLIKVKMLIALDGLVHEYEILEQNVSNPRLEACISQGLEQAVFNKPRGPLPVSVIYTYRFSGEVAPTPDQGSF